MNYIRDTRSNATLVFLLSHIFSRLSNDSV